MRVFQYLADQTRPPLSRLTNRLKVFSIRMVRAAIEKHLFGAAHHYSQHMVEIVGNMGRDPSQHFHLEELLEPACGFILRGRWGSAVAWLHPGFERVENLFIERFVHHATQPLPSNDQVPL